MIRQDKKGWPTVNTMEKMSTLLCLRKKDGRRTDPLENLVTTDDPILHFVRAVLYNAMGFQAESDSESSDWFCFCLYIFVTWISRLVWEKKDSPLRDDLLLSRSGGSAFLLPSRTAFKLTQEFTPQQHKLNTNEMCSKRTRISSVQSLLYGWLIWLVNNLFQAIS